MALNKTQLHNYRQRLLMKLPPMRIQVALKALKAAKKSGELYMIGWEKVVANIRWENAERTAKAIRFAEPKAKPKRRKNNAN